MPDELTAAMARLFVRAKELGDAAVMFNRFLKRKKVVGDALLSLHDSQLRIELAGTAYTVAARGTWPVEVRVRGDLFLGLTGLLSDEDVELVVTGETLTLQVGSTKISRKCVSEVSRRPGDTLPLNAGLREQVAFSLAHTGAEVERLGLRDVVAYAMALADERIKAAVKHLEPLGVSEADVRELARRRVVPHSDEGEPRGES